MYRPKGWKNPYEEQRDGSDRTYPLENGYEIAYEAGADAMYPYAYQKGRDDLMDELRKATATYCSNGNGTVDFRPDPDIHRVGKLVFIPDEESKCQ